MMAAMLSLGACASFPAPEGSEGSIVDEWSDVKAPPPPELEAVTVDPRVTALLILDIQNQNCSAAKRPRCVATLPGIRRLLSEARSKGMTIVYSLTRNADRTDIREESAPLDDEPVVKSGVDKFFRTDLGEILKAKGVEKVIIVGTSAHGAVLHTAVGAALRGLKVILPVDGMSADTPYAEQYTAWHLANGPGSRNQTTLTRISTIEFK